MEYFQPRQVGIGPAWPVFVGSGPDELLLLPEETANWLLEEHQMQYLVVVERDLGIPLPRQEPVYRQLTGRFQETGLAPEFVGIEAGSSGWHMRLVELFEGRLLLLDIFAGPVAAKVGTADTD